MKRLKWVCVRGAVAAMLVGGAVGCTTGGDHETRDLGYGVGDQVRALVVNGGSGDVRVSAGTGGVRVVEHQSYRDTPPVTEHRTEGGTLTLGFRCPQGHCEVGYEVEVPAATVVTVVNGTGEIVLTGLAGEIDARTGTGDVRADGLTSAGVRLDSGTGDVRAEFAAPPSVVRVTAGTGSVAVTVPGGPYAVSAHTGTGQVRVGVDRQPGAGRSVVAESGVGDVTVSGG